MADLVVTCPKTFWSEWIAEGDPAGEPWSGQEWGWYMTGHRPPIGPGDRLYIVARGRLRGYAPVTALRGLSFQPEHRPDDSGAGSYVDVSEITTKVDQWCICRRGNAVAITIPQPIRGFQGYRRVWWSRDEELPFPDWRDP